MPTPITIAHSPDSDDAFMFWALSHGKIPSGDLDISYVLSDIETLNQRARDGVYEVTALSIHAYAHVADKYALMSCGASMGDGYGPMVVARPEDSERDLGDLKIAIPGTATTAWLALQLFREGLDVEVMAFDEIMEAVADGKADAGLLIHEGQLSYEDAGLAKIVDLGEWWLGETGLPLPLGGNAVLRSLGRETAEQITEMLRQSIQYALDHREVAVRYAEQFSRGLETERTDEFVGMYVNDLTLDYGERGRRAVKELLKRAVEKRLVPDVGDLEFV